jgi:hypothetical protein
MATPANPHSLNPGELFKDNPPGMPTSASDPTTAEFLDISTAVLGETRRPHDEPDRGQLTQH